MGVAVIVSIRRLMFKYGKETGTAGLDSFKHASHHVRQWVRYYIYISYVGLFVTLGLYSQMKWESVATLNATPMWVMIYLLLIIGLAFMLFVFCRIKSAYNHALNLKSK